MYSPKKSIYKNELQKSLAINGFADTGTTHSASDFQKVLSLKIAAGRKAGILNQPTEKPENAGFSPGAHHGELVWGH